MRYKYCPDCGKKLILKKIGDEGLMPYCESCKKPLFDYFSTCIIALVVNEYNEVALLRQNYISTTYYNLVSGYMKPGETAEETALREIEEEIGIKCNNIQIIGTNWFAKKELLMIEFIAYGKKAELKLSGEVDDARWVKIDDAINMVHPKGSASFEVTKAYFDLANK